MLNYRSLNILFFFGLLAIVILSNYVEIGMLPYLLLIGIYLALIVLGTFCIQLNFYFHSHSTGNTDKKEIAITFDDGPHPEVTPKVLKLLEDHDIPATFFCVGKSINKHGNIVKLAYEKGHIIGNHSYNHSHFFDLQSSVKMTHELNQTRNSIYHAIGKMPNLFRPPFGVTNPLLKIAVNNSNVISIGWSLRSFDTNKSVKNVVSRLKRKTRPGKIVLLHDTKEKIIPVLEAYLPWLKENNFHVVSLDKLLQIDAYETV